MPLVLAKCTQCGGELQIDSSKDAAVCPYCGNAFIVEKAINHYNTTNIINADNVTVNMESELDKCLSAAENCMLSNREKAYKMFCDISEKYPHDYRAFWGILRVITREFSDYDVFDFFSPESGDMRKFLEKCYQSAYDLANEQVRAEMRDVFSAYIEKCAASTEVSNREKLKLKDKLDVQKEVLEKERDNICSERKYLSFMQKAQNSVTAAVFAIPVIGSVAGVNLVARLADGEVAFDNAGTYVVGAICLVAFGIVSYKLHCARNTVCSIISHFSPVAKKYNSAECNHLRCRINAIQAEIDSVFKPKKWNF